MRFAGAEAAHGLLRMCPMKPTVWAVHPSTRICGRLLCLVASEEDWESSLSGTSGTLLMVADVAFSEKAQAPEELQVRAILPARVVMVRTRIFL